MKTKQLLLTAAIAVVGTAASMAQTVYSVNVVGYVNVTLKPGFNLIANPLNGTNNTIAALMPVMPDGTQLYKFTPGTGYAVYMFDEFADPAPAWTPNGNATLNPGEGAFIANHGTADVVVTFVGEVLQGSLTNTIPSGYSIKSSMVPQAGAVDSVLGIPGADGDQIYQYRNGSGYAVFMYDEFADPAPAWTPTVPSIGVGESFFIRKSLGANWVRSFSVN